jgi:protein SCO1/2
MRQGQKILTAALWALTVVAMMSVIGAGLVKRQRAHQQEQAEAEKLDVFGNVPAFSLVDQDNAPITTESLKGTPWIADFVFTRCAGPCPIMTAKMAELQKQLDPRVKLITISVDPEHDTPPILKQYAQQHSADEKRWKFLTGEKDAVFALARGMLVTALPAQGDQPIVHTTKFILVDGAGQIHSVYESNQPDEIARLIADAGRISKEIRAAGAAAP